MSDIYIRPLKIEDAEISYKWRNNPAVWELTGSKPDKYISLDMELAWMKGVLSRKSERRFAICIANNHKYVGNVQLTNIQGRSAEFHIFIGLPEYWGRGIGSAATRQLLKYAFSILTLDAVYLWVNKKNDRAIQIYEKNGFVKREEKDDEYLMCCER